MDVLVPEAVVSLLMEIHEIGPEEVWHIHFHYINVLIHVSFIQAEKLMNTLPEEPLQQPIIIESMYM